VRLGRGGSARAVLTVLLVAVSVASLATGIVGHPAPVASPTTQVVGGPVGGARSASAVPSTGGPSATIAAHPSQLAGPDSGGWNSNFFHDVLVTFAQTGLSDQFQLVPYTNQVPTTTLGFWVNLSALAPLRFANLTIWGTQWPGASGVGQPITGFTAQDPNATPMVINRSDPNLASYYFDLYRFFWPGSTVYFNVTAVGLGASPAQVKSSTNDSIPITYSGGYTDLATWGFQVDGPWTSQNFSDDISIATTPSILGPVPYEPNPDQAFSITLTAIDLGGTVVPIPDAILYFTVLEDGSATAYSEPFGPMNHTQMSLVRPIGPYPGATVSFNVSAWLPWQSGVVDEIQSPQYRFNWSSNGGWWFPTQGLLTNLELGSLPNVLTGGVVASDPAIVATDQPVNVSIHEPVQNVSIGSGVINFVYRDQGLSHSGSLKMSSASLNTSYALLPGLPPGAMLTFYVVAKDIDGDPVSSGNFSYTETGPTNPPLPQGRGLVFLEVFDLSTSSLVSNFAFTMSNATWSANGTSVPLGFATPDLPGTILPYELGFGTYAVAVTAFGAVHTAEISVSAGSPTPTVVFYGESTPLPTPTTGSTEVASFAAAAGLAAAAIATVPLSGWLAERRQRADDEQKRVTL
jgi:hypothetical protein